MSTKSKSKVREFELDKKFQKKYSDITKIYTIGKVLILEYYTGVSIQSPLTHGSALHAWRFTSSGRALLSTARLLSELNFSLQPWYLYCLKVQLVGKPNPACNTHPDKD